MTELDAWLPPTSPIFGDIELVTGRLLLCSVDWAHHGASPFDFARWYSSFRVSRAGALGPGWVHGFEEAIWSEHGALRQQSQDGRIVELGRVPSLGGRTSHPDGETSVMRTANGFVLWRRGAQKVFVAPPSNPEGVALLEQLRSPDGFVCRLEHDEAGRLLSIVPPFAREAIDLHYDAHGRLAGLGTTQFFVRYDYDAQGRLAQVTSAMGAITKYEYDSAGRLVCRSSSMGSRRYRYSVDQDPAACVTSDDGPGARIEVYVADTHLRTVAIDVTGKAASLRFDPARRPTSSTDVVGRTRHASYDPEMGVLVSTTDRLGHIREWLYDAEGFPALVTNPDGSSFAVDHDSLARPNRIRDAMGNTRRWVWGTFGELIADVTIDGTSRLFEYRDDGCLKSFLTAGGCRAELLTDPDSIRIESPLGRRVARLDSLGRVVQVTDEDERSIQFAYDQRGRLREICNHDLETWTFAYSERGAVTRATGPRSVVDIRRDGSDRVCQVLDADSVSLARDARGFVSMLRGRTGAHHVLVHDARGCMTEHRDPSGSVVRWSYDAEERLTSQSDAMGGSRRVERNAAGRITRVADRGGHEIRFGYDARGALVRADDGNLGVSFERDAMGRVIRETCGDFEVIRTYGAHGVCTGVQTSYGLRLRMDTDGLGRIIGMAEGAPSFVLQRSLDAGGHEVGRRVNRSLEVVLKHDSWGRITSRRILWEGRELRRADYAYEGTRLVQVADSKRGVVSYQYDDAGNIIVVHPLSGCDVRRGLAVAEDSGSPLFEVEMGGRVVHAHGASYEYDKCGRRVLRTEGDGRRTRYAWDPAGRLATVDIEASGGETPPDPPVLRDTSLRFAPLGAREASRTVAYAYDALGRLCTRRVTIAGDEKASARIRRFFWEGPYLVHELEDDQLVTWMRLEGRVVGCVQGGRRLAYLSDPRGTVAEVVDASGALVWSAEADPLASTFAPGGTIHQPWCWDGHWNDDESGVAMTLFRSYDPATCSYLSRHPFAPAAGWNPYGVPIAPVPGYSEHGLAAGIAPHVGSALAPSLEHELAELTLAALGAGRAAPPLDDGWTHFLGPFAPHLPSARLRCAGPWRVFEVPGLMPFREPPG